MIPCNNFIVPIFEADECLGETKPASCVIDSSIYTELSLLANSSQQEINQALYLSAIASKSTTDELQTQIDLIPTGSLQDLQSVLDVGSRAEYDGGNSYVEILVNSADIGEPARYSSDSLIDNGNGYSEILQDYRSIFLGQGKYDEDIESSITMADGIISIIHFKGGERTRLEFFTPLVETAIKIPAKTIAGNYTVLVYPALPYTVLTLPIGQLNDIAVVTDALNPTYLGTLIGGGSVVTPVWHNGTSWVSR